jgi:hypothetical protein
MMGYARRDYGLIGMATKELNSGCSRKDAATDHEVNRHVSVASSVVAEWSPRLCKALPALSWTRHSLVQQWLRVPSPRPPLSQWPVDRPGPCPLPPVPYIPSVARITIMFTPPICIVPPFRPEFLPLGPSIAFPRQGMASCYITWRNSITQGAFTTCANPDYIPIFSGEQVEILLKLLIW